METLKKYKSMLLCLVSLLFTAGMCEEDPEIDDAVLVKKVALDCVSAEINVGRTLALTATVTPDDATNKKLEWSSSNEGVATVENGEVTAIAEGVAAITATAKDGSGKSASCVVTVVFNPNPDERLVESIVLSKTQAELAVGETLLLAATVTPEDADDPSVNWVSSDENVAVVEDGKVTAVGVGSVIVKAIAADGGGAEASCMLTVTKKPIDGGDALSPLAAKNKLESVGLEFVNAINAGAHENLVAVTEYLVSLEYDIDEAYFEKLDELITRESPEENMVTRNPVLALTNMTRACLGAAKRGAKLSTRVAEVWTWAIEAGLTDLYGGFAPDPVAELWKWNPSVNDRVEVSFTDDKNQKWVATLKGSKETTRVHVSFYDENRYRDEYVDGPNAGTTSANHTDIDTEEYTIDVPKQMTFTVKCNGTSVIELSVNSSLAFEASYREESDETYYNYWYENEWNEDGGWYSWYNSDYESTVAFDVNYSNLNVDARLTVNGYEETFKTNVTKSGATASASVKINGKSMMNANACVNADIDALIADGNSEEFKARNIKDISMTFDLLGQVQVDAECPSFKNLYDAIQYMVEAEGIDETNYWLDEMNKTYSVKVRFDNTATTQAIFEAEAEEEVYEWDDMASIHFYPVMVFAADDSRHSIEDYFTENAFSDLVEAVERLAEDFEDVYSEYFEDEVDIAIVPGNGTR